MPRRMPWHLQTPRTPLPSHSPSTHPHIHAPSRRCTPSPTLTPRSRWPHPSCTLQRHHPTNPFRPRTADHPQWCASAMCYDPILHARLAATRSCTTGCSSRGATRGSAQRWRTECSPLGPR
jgi:hypothetical protein